MKNLTKGLFIVSLISTLVLPSIGSAATVDELQAQIQSLMAQLQSLQEQLKQAQGGTTQWCHDFNRNLRVGDRSGEVDALHNILQKEGFGVAAHELGGHVADNGDFGEGTASAVVGFQEKYKDEILTPNGLARGTGYAGPSTRAKLNKLYGCGVTPPPFSGQPIYKVEPSGVLIRDKTYNFQAKATNALPNTRILFYLQRPDGTMKFDGVSLNGAIGKISGSSPETGIGNNEYTDSDGKWQFSTPFPIYSQGQNGTWVSWVTVGGIASNKAYHSVVPTTPGIEQNAPWIDSISPASGPVGTKIEVRGRNFSGFEGDLNFIIQDSKGATGILRGQGTASDVFITIPASVCTIDTSYSGLPCPSLISLSPGVYQIYAYPWGKKSNALPFTITSGIAIQPSITSIVPLSASIGATVTINGNHLNWVVPSTCQTNGCFMQSHVFVNIVNSVGQSYILWEGFGTQSDTSFTVKIPSQVCSGSTAAVGGCLPGYTTLTPGQYKINVSVSGQGQSNSIPFTITSSTQSSITVTSPNGGEVWQVGSTQTIKWLWNLASSLPTFHVFLESLSTEPQCSGGLCSAAGQTAKYNITLSASGSSYNWIVGKGMLNVGEKTSTVDSIPSGQYKITICSNAWYSCDTSDASFSIVAANTTNVSEINQYASALDSMRAALLQIQQSLSQIPR